MCRLEILTDLHRQCVSYNPIHSSLCERIKVFVRPSDKFRLQSIATFSIVLEYSKIQLHGQIWHTCMFVSVTTSAHHHHIYIQTSYEKVSGLYICLVRLLVLYLDTRHDTCWQYKSTCNTNKNSSHPSSESSEPPVDIQRSRKAEACSWRNPLEFLWDKFCSTVLYYTCANELRILNTQNEPLVGMERFTILVSPFDFSRYFFTN